MANFRFAAITTFWAPVTIITPGGEEQEFQAEFTYLDDKAWAIEGQRPIDEFLRQHWTGWRGLLGADDKELPFATALQEQLLGHAFIRQPVIAAYVAARAGQRAKN